jgi:acylphosphatase
LPIVDRRLKIPLDWPFQLAIVNQTIEFFMTSTDKPVLARRYLVRGRVQGVGFRWFVEREAHILGIVGWVRNNHDGTVEVLAQGTRDQLAGLHSRLREGPRAARVDNVEVSEESSTPRLSSFGIEGAS